MWIELNSGMIVKPVAVLIGTVDFGKERFIINYCYSSETSEDSGELREYFETEEERDARFEEVKKLLLGK